MRPVLQRCLLKQLVLLALDPALWLLPESGAWLQGLSVFSPERCRDQTQLLSAQQSISSTQSCKLRQSVPAQAGVTGKVPGTDKTELAETGHPSVPLPAQPGDLFSLLQPGELRLLWCPASHSPCRGWTQPAPHVPSQHSCMDKAPAHRADHHSLNCHIGQKHSYYLTAGGCKGSLC